MKLRKSTALLAWFLSLGLAAPRVASARAGDDGVAPAPEKLRTGDTLGGDWGAMQRALGQKGIRFNFWTTGFYQDMSKSSAGQAYVLSAEAAFKSNPLQLPPGNKHTDEFFDEVETYRQSVTAVSTDASASDVDVVTFNWALASITSPMPWAACWARCFPVASASGSRGNWRLNRAAPYLVCYRLASMRVSLRFESGEFHANQTDRSRGSDCRA